MLGAPLKVPLSVEAHLKPYDWKGKSMKNYIQPGDNITVPAPSDVTAGDLVKVGAIVGVAVSDAKSGELVTLVRKGVFTLAKVSAQAWAQFAKVYITSGGELTTTASGNTLVGASVEAAANPSATGVVLLDGVIR